MIPFRLSQPPFTPPQCFSISSLSGILISSVLRVLNFLVLILHFLDCFLGLTFNRTRLVHVPRDAKELRSRVLLTAKASKPRSSTTADGWGHSDRLNIGHGGRAPKDTNISGKGGLQAGLSGLACERAKSEKMFD